MSSDAATKQMDVTFTKKIFRIILSRVSKSNRPNSPGCTLDDLTAYVQTKEGVVHRTEDLIDATTIATEILLQRGLLRRCSAGKFTSAIPKFTVPQKDDIGLPSSPNITNNESLIASENHSTGSSSNSSSNSTVANPDCDENFHIEPDRRRPTVEFSSSGEDLAGPKTLSKRKGKPVNLPRHRKHRMWQGVKGEPLDLPSSDDEL